VTNEPTRVQFHRWYVSDIELTCVQPNSNMIAVFYCKWKNTDITWITRSS